jgi:L-threonylcarbamoyladenylate synthase
MAQRLFTHNANATESAAALLRAGRLVVFPTDTVYGVGADAWDGTAVARLYQVKERPRHKGIPILLGDAAALDEVAAAIPDSARRYMEAFWPGPLTLIVPKSPRLPAAISANEKVAVRLPDHDVTRALIRAAGGAAAATSANLSGQPPARSGEAALAALGDRVAAVLDDGPAPGGVASTVVDCTVAPPRVLRPGPITAADLSLPSS